MPTYSWLHLADHLVDAELPTRRARDRGEDAVTLSLLAEFDARKRYVPAGYPSMRAYCMGVLHNSEDAAQKRINMARVARKFPAIFPALADGRLHMTGVLLLAPQLEPENVDELIASAAHQSKAQIECLLAARCPKVPVAAPSPPVVAGSASATSDKSANQVAPERLGLIEAPEVAQVKEPESPRTRITPLSAELFALSGAIPKAMREMLAYAKDLLGASLPSGDEMEILKWALEQFVPLLEKRKFGAGVQARISRASRRRKDTRAIPDAVKYEVWQRDGGQCAFVSESGHRCECRRALEFDHIIPKARGGTSTADNLRLLCRAHNQYAAEQVFGAGFMQEKREAAKAAKSARAAAAARAAADEAASREDTDLVNGLRNLGHSLAKAREGAAATAHMTGEPLQERFRVALRVLTPARVRCVRDS